MHFNGDSRMANLCVQLPELCAKEIQVELHASTENVEQKVQ